MEVTEKNKLKTPEEFMVQLQERHDVQKKYEADNGMYPMGLQFGEKFDKAGEIIVGKTHMYVPWTETNGPDIEQFTKEYFARICPDGKCPKTLDELLQNRELTDRIIDVACGMSSPTFPIRSEGLGEFMLAPPPTEWPLNDQNKAALQAWFTEVVVPMYWYQDKCSVHAFWNNNGGFSALAGNATFFENGCEKEPSIMNEEAGITMEQLLAASPGTRTFWLSQCFGLVE